MNELTNETSIENLIKRMWALIEDGYFSTSMEYANRVLEISSTCAEAYLGFEIAGQHLKSVAELSKAHARGKEISANFKRALEYGKDSDWLKEYETVYEAELKLIAEEQRLTALAREKLLPVKNMISAKHFQSIALKSDGTVIAAGDNRCGQCDDVWGWTDIVGVFAGGFGHAAGLKKDGTVVAIGDNNRGQCNVQDWTDIVDLAVGAECTVGLKKDGTVVAVGNNDYGNCNVQDWTDIVSISVGISMTLGIKKDGTVETTSLKESRKNNLKKWTDIVAVSSDFVGEVGLKRDGTVLLSGGFLASCLTKNNWTDIVAVSAGQSHYVGLKRDGTVVAVDAVKNNTDAINVSHWRDIVAISAGWDYTIGLKKDGTVISTKFPDKEELNFGQCDVNDWKLFDNFERIDAERAEKVQLATIKREAEIRDELKGNRLKLSRISEGLCQHCGGKFKGLFNKVCSECKKKKDY